MLTRKFTSRVRVHIGEKLHAATGSICQTAIERSQRLVIKRYPALIRGVAQVLEQRTREFRLIVGQLVYKLVQRLSYRHPTPPIHNNAT